MTEENKDYSRTWPDSEIIDHEQDRFEFADYAAVLADLITHKAQPPLTIGIFGRWGSGKTSLMKLIDENLNNSKPKYRIETLWINVWQLSNQEELWNTFLQAFFTGIHKKIPLIKRLSFNFQLFRKRIKWSSLVWALLSNSYRIVIAVTPFLLGLLWPDQSVKDTTGLIGFVLDPITGGGVSIVLGFILLVKPAIEAAKDKSSIDLNVLLKEAPYEEKISTLQKLHNHFQELTQSLLGKHGRLVIFIDDLDRCTPDKVPEILEAIKLFATASSCVYVLGIDYAIVQEAIRSRYKFEQTASAIEYLDKIIQLPFQMPPLDSDQIMKFVETNYGDVKAYCTAAPQIFSKGLEQNPRKVKRALNIYRTLLELNRVRVEKGMMKEINPELLAKIVVIQSRFPALYNYLISKPNFIVELEKAALEDNFSIEKMPDSLRSTLLG